MPRFLMSLAVVFLAVMSAIARADTFSSADFPKFSAIEPRMVYGRVVYDFGFTGDGPSSKRRTAEDFLKSVINSKFSNKAGSYIVTLDVYLKDAKIISEPILTATWKSDKFFFITTSEKADLVINNNGILFSWLPIDNDTNTMKFSIGIYRSENSTFDLSLFKQISALSKDSLLSKFSPGLAVANDIYAPLQSILSTLLSRSEEVRLVETSTGAFTLLDEGFANQLRYNDRRFVLNIFLKTDNSQLNNSFVAGKFNVSSPELVLTAVKSGTGVGRAPLLEILATGGAGIDPALTDFLRAIKSRSPFKAGYAAQNISASCHMLKEEMNQMITSRDANLVYWAFLVNYADELRRYPDATDCASRQLLSGLQALGLEFDQAALSRP